MIRASLALAKRALRTNLRRPQLLFPLVLMPSLLLAVNAGGLHRATTLPGFERVHGFFDFQLAAVICQSMLIGGVTTGIATALEIEGGFFDRLAASPVPRAALLAGRLVATGALNVGQVLFFLAIGLIFGAHIEAGVPGALLVIALGVTAGVGFAAIGMLLAFRARNASTVQGIFPLVFVVLFVSSAYFPRNLLEAPADWLAAYNPLSYIAEGIRDPIVSSISAATVAEGFAAAAGIAAVFILLALRALHRRLGEA